MEKFNMIFYFGFLKQLGVNFLYSSFLTEISNLPKTPKLESSEPRYEHRSANTRNST